MDAVIKAAKGDLWCGLCGKVLPRAAGIHLTGERGPMCTDCGRGHGAAYLADMIEDACALNRFGELLLIETREHPAFNTFRFRIEFTTGGNHATLDTLVALRLVIEEMGQEYYACGESLAAAVIDLHGQVVRAITDRTFRAGQSQSS